MICVGTDLETSKQGIALAEKHKNIWATVGVHPNVVGELYEVQSYEIHMAEPKVVAIGEVGLDYYRTQEPEKQKNQKEIFEQFIDLAQKTNKPMILHFRDSPKGSEGRAYKDALEILPKDFSNGVAHSFTGNVEEAKKYVSRGMYLGFNGIITFARQYDEVVKYIPLENILLETDSPYLTPEPHRSQRNEPLYVKEVAKKVAELKNISVEKVIEVTTQNVIKLFKISI